MNSLFKLNDAELENSLGVHVNNERLSLDQIYSHINEIYRRELHLDLKYGTMKSYLNRDKCCQFKNKETGEICGETSFAQVDHKTSIWAGGTHDVKNLQQLCANHNRRKYRKEAQLSWL